MALYHLKFFDEARPAEIIAQVDSQFDHPRIGHRFSICKKRYKVKDVVFPAEGGINNTIQEVRLMVEETTAKGNYPPLLIVKS